MYEKYTTSAFIIASHPSGEADKKLILYTKDFGMITGILTGVRNQKSKFKGFTEVGIHIEVTLVKGKHIWRITDVVAGQKFKIQRPNQKTFLRILTVLRQLVTGQEKNEALFGALLSVFDFLERKQYSQTILESLFDLAILRILSCLGYGQDVPRNISLEGLIHESDLLQVLESKTKIREIVASSIKASHLI